MTAPPRAPVVTRVLCLGDSYTIGEGVAPADRWCEQLARMLRERGVNAASPTIVARTGWTTDELSAGIDAARPHGTFDVVTLLIGVNDQYRGRPVTDFRAGFTTLLVRSIAFAGGHAERVIVLSIPDWGVTPFAANRDKATIAAEIDEFNSVVRHEAGLVGAAFVDITPATRDTAAATQVVADGLHPSAEMYAAWAHLALPSALAALQREPN